MWPPARCTPLGRSRRCGPTSTADTLLALNRIYTEWYPSKGYSFNITNSTSYDQYYVHGHTVFDVMVRLTNDIFNTYIRKKGTVNPFMQSIVTARASAVPASSSGARLPYGQPGARMRCRSCGTITATMGDRPQRQHPLDSPELPRLSAAAGQQRPGSVYLAAPAQPHCKGLPLPGQAECGWCVWGADGIHGAGVPETVQSYR